MRPVGESMRRLARRIGRRGASLLFVGSLAFVLAASLSLATPQQLSAPAYQVLAGLAPLPVWAAAWAISGVVSWAQAFVKQDRVAFALSTALWWLYGIAYLIGAATQANPRGWVGGLVWIAFGGWLALIATWPETVDSPSARGPVWQAGDAVVTADAGGVIRTWNAAAEEMFGWTAAEVVGRTNVDVIIPPDLRAAHEHALNVARLRGRLSTTGGRLLDTRALHRDGTVFRVETTLGMVTAPSGTVFSAVVRRIREQ